MEKGYFLPRIGECFASTKSDFLLSNSDSFPLSLCAFELKAGKTAMNSNKMRGGLAKMSVGQFRT